MRAALVFRFPRRRVRAEHLEELDLLFHFREHFLDAGVFHMAFKIDIEIIVPRPFLGRARFDLGHVDLVFLDRQEHFIKRADLVADRNEDRGLVLFRPGRDLPGDHQETRHVMRVVLDRP